jgi:uncharacterized membrane protein
VSSSLSETVDVNAPLQVTWSLWSDVTRWPEFLSHVQKVAQLDDRTFSWWLALPGADKAFTAELTQVVPQERIAWRTTEGVEHAGVVTFDRLDEENSRVTMQIDYSPHGFVERLGAQTNLDSTLATKDLGEFKRTAEEAAGNA